MTMDPSYDSSEWDEKMAHDSDIWVEELKESAPSPGVPLSRKGSTANGPTRSQWNDALSEIDESARSAAMSALSIQSIKIGHHHGGDDLSEVSEGRHSVASIRETEARQKALQKQQEFVRKETIAVRLSKVIVVILIVGAGIAFALMTNKIVKEEEKKDFKENLEAYTKEITEVSQNAADRAFNAIASLSKSITASAVIAHGYDNTTATFPFYTMPFFHVQGGQTKEASGAEAIIFAPLVAKSQKEQWEEYSTKNQDWILKGLEHEGIHDIDPGTIPSEIYSEQEIRVKQPGEVQVDDYILPVWQMSGAPRDASIVNLDLLTRPTFAHTMVDVLQSRHGIVSAIDDFRYLTSPSNGTRYQHNHAFSQHVKKEHQTVEDVPHPQSYMLEPVYESFEENARVVGFVIAIFPWNTFFSDVLPEGIPVFMVINDNCGHVHTYEINGPNVWFLGEGDLTRLDHAHQKRTIEFASYARHDGGDHPNKYHGLEDGESYVETYGASYDELFNNTNSGHCAYVVELHPTTRLEILFESDRPRNYSWFVVGIFGIILLFLMIFDFMVVNRQRKLMATARKTHAVVTSLFPENVQQRILDDVEAGQNEAGAESKRKTHRGSNGDSRSVTGGVSEFAYGSKPIADYFASASIMFADIAGFTAWSSTREPTQVFSLLEKIYHSFDDIARTRGVFKVETVGDCYVAAVGLPEIRDDHAAVISRFARDCLHQFPKIVREMEVFLGPGDLGLRVGLHSGAVTAGVLRGEKSRFQLFGDTVNTASRMESTGVKGRIHISQATRDLLCQSGLNAWVQERGTTISVKGKGDMQTYWLLSRAEQTAMENQAAGQAPKRGSISMGSSVARKSTKGKSDSSQARLVMWNIRILNALLKQIVAARGKNNNRRGELPTFKPSSGGLTVLDEVKEIITLPEKKLDNHSHAADVVLPEAVKSQLEEYVMAISRVYRNNPFHNFEHASHVTQSVAKLMSRIVAPDTIDYDDMCYKSKEASALHDHTYGITSDPLTQFACAFSAMIHDVDHTGIPNAQLVKEQSDLAKKYKNKSVAEQNSVDLSWDLLMSPAFEDLRHCIFSSQEELDRFRQLVVNSVMATDIVDKELGAARKKRWEKAFAIRGSTSSGSDNSDGSKNSNKKRDRRLSKREDVNRKATIVIEHLIQASDVAHTMQHWHVYLKWNERLFHEVYQAYLEGRGGDVDPSKTWYDGELGFFDFYIIPLAKKLKECGVFGVSSDEYLDYARANRQEWEQKGRDIVAMYLRNHDEEFRK